jgi:SOS-response transcriptional repressor LexA
MWTDTYACSRLSDVISWTQTTANVSDEVFGLVVRGESMTNPHGLPSILKVDRYC